MNEPSQPHEPSDTPPKAMSPWKITGWICAGVISASVIACLIIAGVRSKGLTEVTVTALDKDAEPRDHNLPLVKRKEALPDYEIIVVLRQGRSIRLGAKPDTSAAAGLTWHLNDPVSIHEIAGIRLQEQDKLINDALTEVQITADTVTSKNYRFDFTSRRSASVGIRSFFTTPVGKAIAAGFCIAVLLIILSAFCV